MPMKTFLIGLLASASLSIGAITCAQETPPAPPTTTPSSSSMPVNEGTPPVTPMSKHQMMKDCIMREAAKNDGSTKAHIKKKCKAEIRNNMGVQDMLKH